MCGDCLEELQEAARAMDHHGFVNRPNWEQLRFGARPSRVDAERGEWQHGWQYHACSASEHHFRETEIFATSCVADQAHLRSHSGLGAGEALVGCSTGFEFMQPELFRTLVLERLRLPLNVTDGVLMRHWTRWDDTELHAHGQVC